MIEQRPEPATPNLNGKPIALAIAAVYGYQIPAKFCKYVIDQQGRTCLREGMLPVMKDPNA